MEQDPNIDPEESTVPDDAIDDTLDDDDDHDIDDADEDDSAGSHTSSNTDSEWDGGSTSASEDDSWDENDEEGMLRELMEDAKDDVRNQLMELKEIFGIIKEINNEIPEKYRIKARDLKLPEEIYEYMNKRIADECEDIYKVHEYNAAEQIIQLERIKRNYLDPVETPHVVVKDVTHELQVHTIRNLKMTPDFLEMVSNNTETVDEEIRILRETRHLDVHQVANETPPIKRIYAEELIGEYKSKLYTYDVDTVQNIRHLEQRLAQKYERKLAWQELMAKKIQPDFIPVEDLQQLEQLKNNNGSFKLQTSENYEGEQISIAERRQRIIDIKLEMRQKVKEFNEKVFEARNEKPRIIQECLRIQKEIRQVQVLLPTQYRRKIPTIYEMEPDETIDDLWEITDKEVEEEEKALLAAAGLDKIVDEINEEYYGIKPREKEYVVEDESPVCTYIPVPSSRKSVANADVDLEFESIASHNCRRAQFYAYNHSNNEADKKRFEVQFCPRLYRQEILFKELMRVIKYFHERIKCLHDARVTLEIESKVKTIGLLTMINDLEIAKEYFSQEKTISEIVKVQKGMEKSTKNQMDTIKNKLIAVNSDMKKCDTELNQIFSDVQRAIGDKGRCVDFLWKVFKKKVTPTIPVKIRNKKSNKQQGDEEEEDDGDEDNLENEEDEDDGDEDNLENEEDEDEGEAEELEDEDEEEEEEEIEEDQEEKQPETNQTVTAMKNKKSRGQDLDVCPDHCDRSVYDIVVSLRDKRVLIEFEIEENKQLGEQISAEYVELEQLCQKYESRITELEEELRVLQKRRQKRMNDLKLMVILKADQINCLDMDDLSDLNGEMLEKLAQTFPGSGNVIIFPKGGTTILETHATQFTKKGKLEMEKVKRGKRMLLRLKTELGKAEKEVDQLKERVKQEIMLKFGQEVDLDKVSVALVNLDLIDNEMKLDSMKKQQYKERLEIDKDLDMIKYQLTKKIQENSKYNMLQATMLEKRRNLEVYIWKNEKPKQEAEDMFHDASSDVEDGHEQASAAISKPVDTSAQLEQEIAKAQDVLRQQLQKIEELKEIMFKCRIKSGVPPLLRLTEDVCPCPSGDYKPTAHQIPVGQCPEDEDEEMRNLQRDVQQIMAVSARHVPPPPQAPPQTVVEEPQVITNNDFSPLYFQQNE